MCCLRAARALLASEEQGEEMEEDHALLASEEQDQEGDEGEEQGEAQREEQGEEELRLRMGGATLAD